MRFPMMARVRVLAAFCASICAFAALPAWAGTYTVKINNALDIGVVIAAATGDTVFHLDAVNGNVSVLSGGGRRQSAGLVHAQVSIKCTPGRGGDQTCDTDNIRLKVQTAGGSTGRAKTLSNLTIAMSTATLIGTTTGTNPVTFTIAPVGSNGTQTFFVGADFPVAGDNSALASGDGTTGFSVAVVNAGGITIGADSNQAHVIAYRTISVVKNTDLNFGRVGLPTAGAGDVTISSVDGARSVTGTGAFAYPTPATASVANFTVTGEGGQAFSGSIPTSMNMTGPSTVAVSLTNNLGASPTLAGTLGSAGTKSFNVGGTFPFTSATPTGAYSGTLTVTIDYN